MINKTNVEDHPNGIITYQLYFPEKKTGNKFMTFDSFAIALTNYNSIVQSNVKNCNVEFFMVLTDGKTNKIIDKELIMFHSSDNNNNF